MLKAGFYESDITPAIGMERPAVYHKLYFDSVHDPLKVRACVIDDGTTKIAVVGVDTCIIRARTVQKARLAIKEKCAIDPQNILIAASHTHAGGPLWGFCAKELKGAPEFIKHLMLEESSSLDIDYEAQVISQIATAVFTADQKKCSAKLSIGSGVEDKAAFNRCFKMKNGKISTHPGKGNPEIVEPAGPIDPEVGVIAAWDENDKLIGCMVNYACHATCYGDGFSADWIYYLEKTIQGVMGKQANVVFLNGACGDITQVDNQSLREMELGEKWAKYVGGRVGAEAIKVLFTAEKSNELKLAAQSTELALKIRRPSQESITKAHCLCEKMIDTPERGIEFDFAKERLVLDYLCSLSPERKIEIQAIQIGPAVLLANPSEYFGQYSLDIKEKSNFPYTFVVELANGGCGYVPTEEALDPEQGGGYETVLTAYSNLEISAGRKIMKGCLELAKNMTPGKVFESRPLKAVNKKCPVVGPELK